MKLNHIVSAAAVLLLFFAACKNKNGDLKVSDQVQTNDAIPEGFEEFYAQFHRDSLYQMEHISWPLEGARGIQADSTHTGTVSATWMPEGWQMHRLDFLNNNDYQRDWTALGDIMVIERIRARAVAFGIERRFGKQPDGSWKLIYYSDIHEFK